MSFSDPLLNLRKLNLTSGMTVVDFGAGSGAYTIPIARLVAPEGRVYAVEIQKDLLEIINRNAEANGLKGVVRLVWGNIEKQHGVGLRDYSADLVLVANVLFQTKSIYTLALEAKRILRPTGRIAVIDWVDSFGGMGPQPEELVKPEEVKKTFLSAGLIFVSDFFAGEHHYGLIFSKK